MTDRNPANRPSVYDIAIALRREDVEGSGRHRLESPEELTQVNEPVDITSASTAPMRLAGSAGSEAFGVAAS